MSTSPVPCVSVVIPLFNAGAYVEEAIQSALSQPETLEVIVVDDGSIDDGPGRCRALAGNHAQKVLLLTHPDASNHGPGASRNLGIMRAEGEFIAFLDADDYFLPDRFRASVPLLRRDPELDGVYEAVQIVFEGADARRGWDPAARTLVTLPENVPPHKLLRFLARGGEGNFCTDGIVLRRSVFERAGMFDTDLSLGQDTAFWWRLAASCRLVGGQLVRPVAIYRRHGHNRSATVHPDFRGTRLIVPQRTLDWARLHGCRREHLRILESAYARALAEWDAGEARECLQLIVTHLLRSPRLSFAFAFWIGLLRRVTRPVRMALRSARADSTRIAASDESRPS